MSDAEGAVAKAYEALSESATVSKRAVAAHKRALKKELAALEELKTVADRLGIPLEVQHQGQRRPK